MDKYRVSFIENFDKHNNYHLSKDYFLSQIHMSDFAEIKQFSTFMCRKLGSIE